MAYENELTAARPTSEEHTLLPNMEQPVQEPITSSDVILLDEDALSVMEESLRDEAQKELLTKASFSETTHTVVSSEVDQELIRIGYEKETTAIHDWIKFRVKNELIAQVFTGRINVDDPFDVNTNEVKGVIASEMEKQLDQSTQMINYLNDNISPLEKEQDLYEILRPRAKRAYSRKDLGNLKRRRIIKSYSINLIESIQDTGDEGLLDLAERYIEQTAEEAREQAKIILIEQNRLLAEANQKLTEKVDELKEEVSSLQSELAERDIDLFESEMTTHLTAEAKELAK